MQLAKMMEQERRRAAIKPRTYSSAERFSIIELILLRLFRTNPGLTCAAARDRVTKLFGDAKVDSTEFPPLQFLDGIIFGLARAGHVEDVDWTESEDGSDYDYSEDDAPVVTKKGRTYMLAMPKTVQNGATRVMQPYTLLDRIAAAVPKIPKQAKKRRRRRRRRS